MGLPLLFACFAVFLSVTCAITPVEIVGSNFFLQNGNRFYIKGVNYYGYYTKVEQFVNSGQCAIDAAAIKNLGANTIRIAYRSNDVFNITADHDSCMKSFSDSGIYVLIPLRVNSYDSSTYNNLISTIDVFQRYNNTLGFEVLWTTPEGPTLKSVFRDLRAYRDAKGYRSVPVGYTYTSSTVGSYAASLANYSTCPSPDTDGIINNRTTAEFYGVVSYSWCGSSSMALSGYDAMTATYARIGVPVFFAETGCVEVSPRRFTDQAAIFGPQMVDVWSGAIVYAWRDDGNGSSYQLASYAPGSALATPTRLPDYTYLSSQWATLTPTGTIRPSTKVFPSCPTTDAQWNVNPSVTLPTIAGLRTGSSYTAGATDSSATGSGIPRAAGGLPKPIAIGIGIGAGLLLLLVIGFTVLILLRRRNGTKQRVLSSNSWSPLGEKAEMSAGPVNSLRAGKVKPKFELHAVSAVPFELPGESSISTTTHELPSPTGSGAPLVRGPANYIPPELNSNSLCEVSQPSDSRSRSSSCGANQASEKDDSCMYGVKMQVDVATASTAAPRASLVGINEAELAEEADIAVQELGLISVRRRNLTAAALAAGVVPEDLPGRKGEEWADLLQREQRVRRRLEEIEEQRQQLV